MGIGIGIYFDGASNSIKVSKERSEESTSYYIDS